MAIRALHYLLNISGTQNISKEIEISQRFTVCAGVTNRGMITAFIVKRRTYICGENIQRT